MSDDQASMWPQREWWSQGKGGEGKKRMQIAEPMNQWTKHNTEMKLTSRMMFKTWLDGLLYRLKELCCYYEGLIYESISQMLVFNILILWHLRNTVVIPTKSYSLQNDLSIVLTFQGGRSGRWNIFLWHLFIFMYGHPLLIQIFCLTMHWCSTISRGCTELYCMQVAERALSMLTISLGI